MDGIVSIREWRLDDAAAVAKSMNNKAVQDNLRDGIPFPYTEKDGKDFISSAISAEPNIAYQFAIVLDGDVVGSIGATRQQNIHSRTAEMGYYIGEPYWGRGIAAQAVRLLSDFVFKNTDILRIFAEPFAYNTASCRVLEKAGFSLEGTLRSNAVKNGQVLDMKLYSLIRGDISLE